MTMNLNSDVQFLCFTIHYLRQPLTSASQDRIEFIMSITL